MKKYSLFLVLLVSLLMINGTAFADQTTYDDGVLVTSDGTTDYVYPKTDSATVLGKSGNEWANIYADSLVVGGVTYTTFAAGTDGNWTDNGTTTTLDQAPTAVIITHATGNIAATGFTAGTGDILLENSQKIDGATNNAIAFGDNSDTFTATFTGDDISLNTSDGGFIFALTDATDGTLDVQTNNDTDDYIQFSTTANVPAIGTTGNCNLALIPDSGIVAITGGLTTTTTIAATGVITATAGVTLQNGATVTEAVDGTTVIGGEASPIVSILATGTSDNDGTLQISSDNATDNGDVWQVQADGATQDLLILNNASGSQATKLTIADTTGLVTLTGGLTLPASQTITLPDSETITNASDVVIVTADDAAASLNLLGFEANTANLKLYADQDDDASDGWRLTATTSGTLTIGNDSSVAGTDVVKLTIGSDALVTTAGDVTVAGTTPLLTVGDGGAEQAAIVIDAATTDFYAGVYNTDGDFYVGTGSTVATNPALRIVDTTLAVSTYGDITMTGTTPTLTIGDAGAEDAGIVIDGSVTDFHMQIDDTNGDLYIGTGSVAGTAPCITITDTTGAVTVTNAITHSGAVTNSSTVANNGDVTFGDASTDTVTMTGRLIVRTVASTVATAGATGEVVFCSGDSKFYGVTVGGASATFSALN